VSNLTTPQYQLSASQTQKKRKSNLNEGESYLETEASHPTHVMQGSLQVNGSVRATSFVQFSDLRLKANILEIKEALSIVARLQGKTYTWKHGDADSETGGKRVLGLIAQASLELICRC
jgi:hypothetical protein